VNDLRWINPHQPQTLMSAVILCYIQAFFALIRFSFFGPLGLFILVGMAAGGFGIANEKKWGYTLAVAAAGLEVILFVARGGLGALGDISVLFTFVFDVLLVVLLMHPMSRSYERTWFK
jgi:xanthine/uracil permease